MRINDSWGIQRESMLSSHIYHLVWFSNLLGPFVSSIRNHLIESPKSISLCFQLAYCCPFWLTAYNDSLVSGISKSVFGGSDLFPRTVIFTAPPVIEKHVPFSVEPSRPQRAPQPSRLPQLVRWRNALVLPWLASFPPEALNKAELLRNIGHREIREESSIGIRANDAHAPLWWLFPVLSIASWLLSPFHEWGN